MTITTAPAAAADLAVCCVVPPELIGWDRYDWLESYADDSYERTVIWASDDNCRLAPIDLEALFRAHGADLEEYRLQLVEQVQQDLPVLHRCHAGQALTWLGY